MTHRRSALLGSLLVFLAAAPAFAFDTAATAAYVVDVNTGTVLMDKDGDTPMPPASMSKLMTIDLLFEALADGRVTMDNTLPGLDRGQEHGRLDHVPE